LELLQEDLPEALVDSALLVAGVYLLLIILLLLAVAVVVQIVVAVAVQVD
jgi:hypothetical protein